MIRPARADEAAQISAVLVASVTRLCGADHGDDPERLAQWLANKTPQAVARRIADPATRVYVAGDCAAVGAIALPATGPGEIALLYVHPDAQGRGHSAALLRAMEDALRDQGFAQARLTATTTARRFYERRGWQPDGPARIELGVLGHPMRKTLR